MHAEPTGGCVAAWCAGILLIGVGICRGDYVLVEDFEALAPGDVDGQNGWVAWGLGGEVVADPEDESNQVLELTVDTGVVHKPLLIAEGTSRMLFLRFRYEGQHNYSLGLSRLGSPTEFSDFGPELRKSGAMDELKIHDGTSYADLTVLEPAHWYNLWVQVNNDTRDSRVWLHDRGQADATSGDQLDASGQTVFDFRLDAPGDLIRLYLKAADGGSGRDPLWIDDVYVEQAEGVNLSHPVPEPASGVLVSIAVVIRGMSRTGRCGAARGKRAVGGLERAGDEM